MERKPLVNQIKEESMKVINEEKSSHLLIPTGCALLDLACSGSTDGGWGVGKMVNLIGDSSSGKTLIALSMLAEMVLRPEFDDYRFVYDDVERSLEFDIVRLFGSKTKKRIESPYLDDQYPDVYVIEEFQYNVEKFLKSEKPFVYVLDSFDSLSSKGEVERTEKSIKARESGKDLPGSYKMEKAKIAGEVLRQIVGKLKNLQSFLLIISQTRDNIDPMSFQKKTRSGGNALRFYATHEIWLAVVEKLRDNKYKRVIGHRIKAKVSKNKLTGRLRDVEFSTYYDLGVDNVGCCVDFLIEEGVWKREKLTYDTGELGLKGTRESVISQIEQGLLEKALLQQTQKAWDSMEDGLKLDRKRRY